MKRGTKRTAAPRTSPVMTRARSSTWAELIVKSELDQRLGDVELSVDMRALRRASDRGEEALVSFHLPNFRDGDPGDRCRAHFYVWVSQIDRVLAALQACAEEARAAGILPPAEAEA